MRTKDVRVGQTYRCEVPYSLPLGRFRPETMGPSCWTLSWLRGTHFPLTVVDIDPQARTVEGLRVATSTRVTVDLTDDQVQAVGLPPGRNQVAGMLLDVEGEPVELPRAVSLTVPIRWLRPTDTPASSSHHDASVRGG
ncbi:hypothetical protein [Streptomyces virginiae]|uniref:hypothetical protein n=1 Tax=Streptomyces virginiae TaxID=1961 RepID=UPI002258F5B3|nr:hypothetical protein [Streptomyces virginiae]MCX5278221.1 hypothetical protein [Streptomyces virginiae]